MNDSGKAIHGQAQAQPPHPHGPGRRLADHLAEPFAFALVTWPAAALVVHLTDDTFWLRLAAGVWLLAFQFAAYGHGRGVGFGNAMLITSGVTALAWWAFPSPWCWLAFPLLLIGLHGAQRALLRHRGVAPGVDAVKPVNDPRARDVAPSKSKRPQESSDPAHPADWPT
ncbi:MAG: hypothetical protein KDH20_03100 [Rhodocyclaceae bacterium]|nr:hypothetical protein [Rhodocyclaceae bacterium]